MAHYYPKLETLPFLAKLPHRKRQDTQQGTLHTHLCVP